MFEIEFLRSLKLIDKIKEIIKEKYLDLDVGQDYEDLIEELFSSEDVKDVINTFAKYGIKCMYKFDSEDVQTIMIEDDEVSIGSGILNVTSSLKSKYYNLEKLEEEKKFDLVVCCSC